MQLEQEGYNDAVGVKDIFKRKETKAMQKRSTKEVWRLGHAR